MIKIQNAIYCKERIDYIATVGLALNPPELLIALKNDPVPRILIGIEAVDFIMRYYPAAIEGMKLKHARHAWIFHNLIAHPLMQILALFGFPKLGLKIHDMTIPRPKC